jgi:hypothetical protein
MMIRHASSALSIVKSAFQARYAHPGRGAVDQDPTCLACAFQFIAHQSVEVGKSLIRRRELDKDRGDRPLPQGRLPAPSSQNIGCLSSKAF